MKTKSAQTEKKSKNQFVRPIIPTSFVGFRRGKLREFIALVLVGIVILMLWNRGCAVKVDGKKYEIELMNKGEK